MNFASCVPLLRFSSRAENPLHNSDLLDPVGATDAFAGPPVVKSAPRIQAPQFQTSPLRSSAKMMGNSPGAFQIRWTTSVPGGSEDPRRSSVFSVRLRSFLRFGLALFTTETSTEMDPLSLEQSDKSSAERNREPSLFNPLVRALQCGTR